MQFAGIFCKDRNQYVFSTMSSDEERDKGYSLFKLSGAGASYPKWRPSKGSIAMGITYAGCGYLFPLAGNP
jgi:hypothetical protein